MARFIQPIQNAGRKTAAKLKPLTKNIWIFFVILIALGGAQAALFIQPIVGAYITGIAFALLVGLALWKEKVRELAVSAAILPAATMISLSLPQTTAFAQITIFYVIILALALVYRFVLTLDYPLSRTSMSRRSYLYAIPLMIVIGEVLGAGGYGLLRHQYPFDHTALPLVAAALAVFAIAEEMMFRGLIQQQGSLTLNAKVAAVLSAVLYTLYLFGHTGSWLSPLMGGIMGIVLAFVYYKKPNLLLTITLNMAAKLTYVGLMASFIFR